jgi:hypothetical protein
VADIVAKDPSSEAIRGNVTTYSGPHTFEKYAGFIDLMFMSPIRSCFNGMREIYIDLVLNMVILGGWPLPTGLK